MLTQYTRYALKALLYMARRPRDLPVPVVEIAENAHVPRKFLETILVDLKRRGFVISTRGKRGGYRLARPPEQILFGEVIRQFEGPMSLLPSGGIDGPNSDPEEQALRGVIAEVTDQIAGILNNVSLAEALSKAGAQSPISNEV